MELELWILLRMSQVQLTVKQNTHVLDAARLQTQR